MKLARYIRMMYAVTALSGALLLHEFPDISQVYAQQISQTQTQPAPYIWGIQSGLDTNSKLIDQLNIKEDQIDHHLEATDSRINDLSDKISLIQGIGSGVLGILGVLQIFGLITTKRNEEKADG